MSKQARLEELDSLIAILEKRIELYQTSPKLEYLEDSSVGATKAILDIVRERRDHVEINFKN